ncbi:MAG TPA: pitrilysin family protein [Vicinamibacterales bacterium]|nr:pitrilysin family protein [Vicinamibacterales bacterium]
MRLRLGPAVRVAALGACLLAWTSIAAAQVADWPTERPPRPLPAREVKFPPYQIRTLPNGLQVIAVSHHEQPAVSLRLIVRAGGAQDPMDKPGVASLAAALLDQGTTTRSAEQIASAIESIGGLIGTGAGSDLTFINAVVMKDSLDLALDMVADLARNPAFAPDEIDRQRQQILSGLKVSYEDPDYLAGVVFDRLVYGVHPYGRPDSGTPATIASITREDLLAHHRRWFGANNAILAIVGDVQPDVAFAGAARAFGNWSRVETEVIKPIDPPPATRRLIVIDRPGAVQTEIRAGNLALPRKHPDYLALDLALKILGGEGGNRLHRVLRSERGLTYGASADVHALKESGDLVAETDTRSESTAEALRLIVDEMWRLQRQRVQERELADAQAYLTGSFPLTIETPSAIALQVLNAVFYGLDLEELETFRERVNSVTPDDIQRVARAYLRPDRLSIVLVGDASVFSKQLTGAGFDEFERIPLTDLDLIATDLRRPGSVPANRREPESDSSDASTGLEPAAPHSLVEPAPQARPAAPREAGGSARELIDRAVQAKGGLEKLRAVRTIRVSSTTAMQSDRGRAEAITTTWIRYPGAYRVELEGVAQLFLAGDYFVVDSRGARQASAPAAAEMKASVQRDTIPLLIALAEGRLQARRTSYDAGGRPLPALEVQSSGMAPMTIAFDPETGLIARQQYPVSTPSGAATAEETFSDYRSIEGLQVAFKAIVRRPGAPVIERTIRTFEYNIPLDSALFTRPS